jgi:cell filamentation protein
VEKAAHVLAELNAIHPFREGNGRTQLAYLILLAERARHPLAMKSLSAEDMLKSTIRSFQGDETPLAKIISELVKRDDGRSPD